LLTIMDDSAGRPSKVEAGAAVAPAVEAPGPASTSPAPPPVPAPTEPIAPPAAPAIRTAFAVLPGAFLIIAVWAVLQLWGLDRAPFHTKGEPREAIVVQEIVHKGSWILPRRNGIEMPAKPPLFHWLGALASHLRGQVDEASVRLPSAILSLAAALAIFLTGALLWSFAAGVTAAAAILTSFEWIRAATSARVDMTLTAGLTFTVCALVLFRAQGGLVWLLVAYAGIAWAILSKGPVGLALPLLLVIALTLVDRRLRFVRSLRLIRGLVAVLVAGSAWYLLAFFAGGQAFFAKQILTENLWRFLGGSGFTEGHRHSAVYLLAALAAGLLPWTVLMPSVLFGLWRKRRTLSRRDPQLALLIWSAVVFGFYAVAESKRGVYLLASYPGLFLLLGWWVDASRREAHSAAWLARALPPLAWCMAFVAGALALIAAGEGGGLPLLSAAAELLSPREARDLRLIASSFRSATAPVAALLAGGALAAAAAACAARAQRWGLAVTMLFLAVAPAIITVRQVVLPGIARANTREPFVDAIKRSYGDRPDLYAHRGFDYGFVYYWGCNVPVYRDALSATGPARVVVSADDWQRASPKEREIYRPVPLLEAPRGGNFGALMLAQRVRAAPREAHAASEGGQRAEESHAMLPRGDR
jgi:4-amino-4-deoxy-L-arabinose transferase-like glycosyltransferase